MLYHIKALAPVCDDLAGEMGCCFGQCSDLARCGLGQLGIKPRGYQQATVACEADGPGAALCSAPSPQLLPFGCDGALVQPAQTIMQPMVPHMPYPNAIACCCSVEHKPCRPTPPLPPPQPRCTRPRTQRSWLPRRRRLPPAATCSKRSARHQGMQQLGMAVAAARRRPRRWRHCRRQWRACRQLTASLRRRWAGQGQRKEQSRHESTAYYAGFPMPLPCV